MKLLQKLLEEKGTNQQILKVIGKFLIDLNKNTIESNKILIEIKDLLKENNNPEKVIIEKVIEHKESSSLPDIVPPISVLDDDEDSFIPSIDDNDMKIVSKNKTITIKKDFASKAQRLKEKE